MIVVYTCARFSQFSFINCIQYRNNRHRSSLKDMNELKQYKWNVTAQFLKALAAVAISKTNWSSILFNKDVCMAGFVCVCAYINMCYIPMHIFRLLYMHISMLHIYNTCINLPYIYICIYIHMYTYIFICIFERKITFRYRWYL